MRRAWLLLVFAAALALWLWRSPRNEAPDNVAGGTNRSPEPGYVATGAVLFDTDANGQPQYRLRASRIEQSDATADIEITAPEFHYQGSTDWTLTAQRGQLPPDARRITLQGEVQALAERGTEVPRHLSTNSLTVDMEAQHAETSDAVLMDWGRNRLWAAGLDADMKADSLRLKSPIHGEFARR